MQNKRMIQAAILTMSVVQMGTTAIAPIMADIAGEFPEAGTSTVQFLMTFPSLFVMITTLFSVPLTRRIEKKHLAAMGCGLFSISGLLSWMFHDSLFLLYLWAAVMGIGVGLAVPMAVSLITDFFVDREQQVMMGWQSSAANIGAMLMTFFGGLLAQIHWSCNYLVYLIAIPGFLFSTIGLPASKPVRKEKEASSNTFSVMVSLLKNPGVQKSCVIALAITMLFNITPVNLSMFMAEKGLGTAAQAGTASTLLLLSGTIGGLCFGRVAAALGRRVMCLGFAILAAGQLICAMAAGVPQVFLGCLICGCAISMVMPQAIVDAAVCAKEYASDSSAVVMTFSYIGGFCTPIITMAARWITGNDNSGMRFILGAVLALLVMGILFFWTRKEKASVKE